MTLYYAKLNFCTNLRKKILNGFWWTPSVNDPKHKTGYKLSLEMLLCTPLFPSQKNIKLHKRMIPWKKKVFNQIHFFFCFLFFCLVIIDNEWWLSNYKKIWAIPTITRRVEQPLKSFVLDVKHMVLKEIEKPQKKVNSLCCITSVIELVNLKLLMYSCKNMEE